jgi:hypothetical protein
LLPKRGLKNGTTGHTNFFNTDRESFKFPENLFYPLNNDTPTIGYRTGSSNHVAKDGIVVVEHVGDLLMMECID